MRGWFAAALALLLAPALAAAGAVTQVDVVKQGSVYVIDAAMAVPVPAADAWAVLIDFDDMARFLPNLTESRTTARSGNRITVQQKGVARFGILRIPFDSVREIDLKPHERVRARQIAGRARSALSEMRFIDDGGTTRIVYRAEIEPGFWLPAFVSRPFIEHEVREQFEAIAREILRRRGHAVTGRPVEARQ
ncbi:MAG: SRPBCC family protein [Gemmatimonadota bacterium]